MCHFQLFNISFRIQFPLLALRAYIYPPNLTLSQVLIPWIDQEPPRPPAALFPRRGKGTGWNDDPPPSSPIVIGVDVIRACSVRSFGSAAEVIVSPSSQTWSLSARSRGSRYRGSGGGGAYLSRRLRRLDLTTTLSRCRRGTTIREGAGSSQ